MQGKVGLVTGAASGIGRATALELARAQAHVTVADVDEAGGRETVERIRAEGGTADFVRCDVAAERDVEALVRHVIDQHGRLDFAHNNAGIAVGGYRVDTLPEAVWDHVMGVNLKGVWLCLKHELRVMRRQRAGAIVNTASVCGYMASSSSSPYNTSKHGVIGLTKEAAIESGPLGIRVNAICPGFVATPAAARIDGEEMARRVRERVPAQRLAQPEEVADAVVWMLSDRAAYLNGTGLVLDGGLMLSFLTLAGAPVAEETGVGARP
jgi:NAD(P)-dependent dehydrogenase (short-subunit alcohol dehydrogenase family)